MSQQPHLAGNWNKDSWETPMASGHSPRLATWTKLLEKFHCSPISGHGWFMKAYKRLSHELHWERMRSDVKGIVSSCPIYQPNKYDNLSSASSLQPPSLPQTVWQGISMGFIGGLPKSYSYDTILKVADCLSKYGHFILLKHPFTAKPMAEAFLSNVGQLHGFLRSIVSNRDKTFMSHFWNELFRLQQT